MKIMIMKINDDYNWYVMMKMVMVKMIMIMK